MDDYQARTRILLGDVGLERLTRAHVLVAGVGGVGGSCVEALGRAGVGTLTLVDFDCVAASNCNRQVVALRSTEGRLKVDVMAERLRDINPDIRLNLISERITPADAASLLTPEIDLVLDCIDAIASKVALVKAAQDAGRFVASSMGAGARMDATLVRVADLYETKGCPMATAMRKQSRRQGVKPGVRAVFSLEPPMPHIPREWVPGAGPQKTVNGTISYMPGMFGFFMASEGLRHLLQS